MDRVDLLIEILFDPYASPYERDDAALDLSSFDDARAIYAFEKYAEKPIEDHILDICGETIAIHWMNHGIFDKKKLVKFVPQVQGLIISLFKQYKPQLLKNS